MLGDIDRDYLKPMKPELFLCKPNMTTVGKLVEAFDISHQTRLADVNEISFSLPYYIDVRNKLIKNPSVDKIKHRFLIKLKLGVKIEYYIINSINENSEDGESVEYHAYSLGYELRDKNVRSYTKESINAKSVMKDALSETVWTIGENLKDDSHYFNGLYRSFDISSNTVLEFVQEIAEAFDAVIIWNTSTRTIDFELPGSVGQNKGLSFSYGKYLKSIGKESSSDEMVTSLTPYGLDGLTIHKVNPTGSGYIEDFSHFLYPFKRDGNKNTLQSSAYMSDGLCHAILDYKEKVVSVKPSFSVLLDDLNRREVVRSGMESQLSDLETIQYTNTDTLDALKATSDFASFTGPVAESETLENLKHYIFLAKSNTGGTASIVINGVTHYVTNNWSLIFKTTGQTSFSYSINGNATLHRIWVKEDEYLGIPASTDPVAPAVPALTNTEFLEKYSADVIKSKVDAKQAEIDSITAQINAINKQINDLQSVISIENNFTPSQITERSLYVINRDWTDDNYFSEQELYDEALKKFEELKNPQVVINIDIVNFLDIIDEQNNWKKLVLGDTVTIRHEKIDVSSTAKIIEMEFNYESGDISLTIANTKDIEDDDEKFTKLLYGAISTSSTVQMNKFKWDLVEGNNKAINSLISNAWDATKQRIIAGTNESVEISRRGIIIQNPDDDKNYLIANHAVLAITNDGGLSWKHAITPDGIIGDRLIGRIIAGENLSIENSGGTFRVTPQGVIIYGMGLEITGGLPEEQMDSGAVAKWNQANAISVSLQDKNFLTPLEKRETQREWTNIANEYPTLLLQAKYYSPNNSLNTTYTNAYNSLNKYLNVDNDLNNRLPILHLNNTATNSAIVRDNYNTLFSAYYNAKVALENYMSKAAKDLADTAQASVTEFSKQIVYKVELTSSNGDVFRNGDLSTIMLAKVYRGRDEITSTLPNSAFIWKKFDKNGVLDTAWTNGKVGIGKQITVLKSEIQSKATYQIDIDLDL